VKIWIVMECWRIDDDGDSATEFEAVHATEAGARANLEPDYATTGHRPGSRERYCFEAEILRP